MTVFTRVISFCFSCDIVWFRLGKRGPGIAFKRSPALFSERYGYTPNYNLLWGWRLVLMNVPIPEQEAA